LEKGVGRGAPAPPHPKEKKKKKTYKEGDGFERKWEKSTGTLFPFIAREHTSIRIVHKLMHVGGCLCIC